MPEPTLKILGMYRPLISAKTWREQWRVTANDERTREHFDKLVLIEAIVDGLTERFNMGQLGQMQAEHPNDPRYMQVGYDEGLLSADGETLIQRDMNCVHGTCPLRFAVYLHFCDPERPLQWQHGKVDCPPVLEAPARLMMIMPYRACT